MISYITGLIIGQLMKKGISWDKLNELQFEVPETIYKSLIYYYKQSITIIDQTNFVIQIKKESSMHIALVSCYQWICKNILSEVDNISFMRGVIESISHMNIQTKSLMFNIAMPCPFVHVGLMLINFLQNCDIDLLDQTDLNTIILNQKSTKKLFNVLNQTSDQFEKNQRIYNLLNVF